MNPNALRQTRPERLEPDVFLARCSGAIFEDLVWPLLPPIRVIRRSISGAPALRTASAFASWAGQTTFALPDLRGRVVIGAGDSAFPSGLTSYFVGETTGVEFLYLDADQPPVIPPSGAVPEPATFGYVALLGLALLARKFWLNKKRV
jgi:hypothetical protein